MIVSIHFRRRDIKRNLEQRKEKKVDPYRTGWKHMENTQSIDLNAVKLCFHVWYESDVKGKCTRPMAPVCSDIIYDAKVHRSRGVARSLVLLGG